MTDEHVIATQNPCLLSIKNMQTSCTRWCKPLEKLNEFQGFNYVTVNKSVLEHF